MSKEEIHYDIIHISFLEKLWGEGYMSPGGKKEINRLLNGLDLTEKKILEKMINNPGKTFSREDIGMLIDLDKERSIDVIITRLRKKIEMNPKNPKFLQTIRGAGYVLWIE